MASARATDQDLKEAFDLFDADGSGKIDEQELAFALKSIGYNKVTKSDIDLYMADFPDRKVDYPSFLAKVREGAAAEGSPAEIKTAFKMFDEEGSGSISVDNFIRVSELVEGEKVSEEFARAVIASADFDRDGVLNYGEFEYAVTKYKYKASTHASAPAEHVEEDVEEF